MNSLKSIEYVPGFDGGGIVRLTWRQAHPVNRRIETIDGSVEVEDLEVVDRTEERPYSDLAERDAMVATYSRMIYAGLA